jgi:hypothetical protein
VDLFQDFRFKIRADFVFEQKRKLVSILPFFSIKPFIIFEVREMWFFIFFNVMNFYATKKFVGKWKSQWGPLVILPWSAVAALPFYSIGRCCSDDAHATRFQATPRKANCYAQPSHLQCLKHLCNTPIIK